MSVFIFLHFEYFIQKTFLTYYDFMKILFIMNFGQDNPFIQNNINIIITLNGYYIVHNK